MVAAVSIWLSLRRFRDVANEIGQGRIGDYAFSQRNIVPELSSVAHDFDKLVIDLKRLSQQIRQSAEDNAHSFKTPLAAIQSSLTPVRRAVATDDQRARRALEIIDSSLKRLLTLVTAAQRFDNNTADLIEAPRVPTNLTQLVGEAMLNFREIMASRDIRMLRRLARGTDLLVFNCVVLDPPGSPAVLYELHTPPATIGEIAASSHAKRLLLSHLSPAVENARAAVQASISKAYPGPTTYAEDGMRLVPR